MTEVTFQQPFPAGVTPVILTEIRNPNYSTGNNTTSLNVRVFDVTNTGFKFIIYSEASTARKIAISQSVCYLAITPGIGSLDEENGLIIAAGLGEENMIGGISARDNNFYVQKGEEKEILLFYQPTMLVAMQTNNYPAASMLRRTDITLKDDEGTTWTAGVKIKRILDHDLTVDGSTIKTTTLDDAYQDKIGWVVIAKYKEGGSAPSAISTINAQPQKGTLSPRIVNGRIYVDGANHFEVYSPTGARVNATSALTTGIYVVKANGQSAKILVK